MLELLDKKFITTMTNIWSALMEKIHNIQKQVVEEAEYCPPFMPECLRPHPQKL